MNEYAVFAAVQIALLIVLCLAVSWPAINDYRLARRRRQVLVQAQAKRQHRR
jgi:hypothetical protein